MEMAWKWPLRSDSQQVGLLSSRYPRRRRHRHLRGGRLAAGHAISRGHGGSVAGQSGGRTPWLSLAFAFFSEGFLSFCRRRSSETASSSKV